MAMWKGRPVGTFGDIAAFSTMYRKASITGASGGVVYTRDESLFHMALAWADRGKTPWIPGFDDKDPSQFLFPALNNHTDELSCAVGLASWRRLPKVIEARMTYVRGLDRMANSSRLCRPYGWRDGDSPFFYPIRVDVERLPAGVTKKAFAEAVAKEGIGLNPHYMYVVADWGYLKPYLADDFDVPNARAIRDSTFNLFVNEKYGAQEVEDTIAAILKVESALLD
jgi:dTDP-4-amino-4,6-dideoxygalactose transaminase